MNCEPEPGFRIAVALTNPGQFFACCGLLELTHRFWGGSEGWFQDGEFLSRPLARDTPADSSLGGVLNAVAAAPLMQIDTGDDASSPLQIGAPFHLRLDWWKDSQSGGARLKVWAGRMSSVRIARAMQHVLKRPELQHRDVLDFRTIVYDLIEPDEKVEPFYFDARRGSSAHPIDVGFSPDTLKLTSNACPAVEFLALVGLQRFRPQWTQVKALFDYYAWSVPLPTAIAPLAACGVLNHAGAHCFRFENGFRTGQRKLKAFMPASPIARSQQ